MDQVLHILWFKSKPKPKPKWNKIGVHMGLKFLPKKMSLNPHPKGRKKSRTSDLERAHMFWSNLKTFPYLFREKCWVLIFLCFSSLNFPS